MKTGVGLGGQAPYIIDEKEWSLRTSYSFVRRRTEALTARLSPEDQQLQSMEDASPAKWHRAHTSWFFEEFVLCAYVQGYRRFDNAYRHLFNSYYEQIGARHARPKRGILSRPSCDEIGAYRAHVDHAMATLFSSCDDAGFRALARLGLAHEEQHQELILTDILHAFSENPLRPAYDSLWSESQAPRREWLPIAEGVFEIGVTEDGFAFDNEGPAYEARLTSFLIEGALVTNERWLTFMQDGGYERAELWLSDGWTEARRQGWNAPGYWYREDGENWSAFTLAGSRSVDPKQPVCHVSYYEADAFARWCGKRLPTEQEWEASARRGVLKDAFGSRWQWTASAYMPYPGYRPAAGAVGEYNGKFMVNQLVLRGSSHATAPGHARPTYRNFFYPHQRWQFTGLRLTSDIE